MNTAFTSSEDPSQTQATRATPGSRSGGRLLRRTFIIALVLVSGGLLTSGAVELFFRYRESVASIWVLQQEMAQGAAFKIQQFVQDIEKTMRASTQTSDIVTAGLTTAYRFQLIKLLKVTPAITTATVLDANGRELLKESRVEITQPQELGDYSSDEAFVQVRGGAPFFSPVYFVRQSEPYMRTAVPIEPFAGEVIGVLITEVNLKYIWEVISQIKVGQTGYAYVVSREGDLIAHPDISLVLQKRNLRNLGQVQAALAGAPGPFVAQPNLAGQQVFPAYAVIPNLGWAVLVERPTDEAYAPLYASILRTSVLLLVGLGMAALASFLIGRRVIRPVEVLRQGAAQIGAGTLGHRIAIHTGDELEALATEFNSMAARLQESYTGLEQKVEERTRELARSVEELQALGEVGQAVNSTLDLQTVLTTIVARAVQISDANGGVIYEYDEAARVFDLRASHSTEPEILHTLQGAPIPLGEGAIGRAAATQAPVQVSDMRDEQAFVLARVRPILVRLGYRSLLAVPLLLEQRIMGGLVVWRQESGNFAPRIVNLLQTFATQSTLAIQNARLFREIEERGREIAIASRHKSQFLANMSHELRTPLNGIQGYTELIMDGIYGEAPEKIKEVMERIQQSGNRLLGLINAVLDLSKIEAGRLTLSLADYAMQGVVHNVFTAVEPLAAEKKLALSVNIQPDLPVGKGDEQRITQVLTNLVGNAIKFTEVGTVAVQVAATNGAFMVAVSDTGIGIAEADQQKVFEEFQQADSSNTRQKGGSGLGLAIAKKIIEMHNGRIWVESHLGQGSTFRFTLPVRVEQQKEVT
jgi:signal transduction histidine kinase/HAMP domain-containing protein